MLIRIGIHSPMCPWSRISNLNIRKKWITEIILNGPLKSLVWVRRFEYEHGFRLVKSILLCISVVLKERFIWQPVFSTYTIEGVKELQSVECDRIQHRLVGGIEFLFSTQLLIRESICKLKELDPTDNRKKPRLRSTILDTEITGWINERDEFKDSRRSGVTI